MAAVPDDVLEWLDELRLSKPIKGSRSLVMAMVRKYCHSCILDSYNSYKYKAPMNALVHTRRQTHIHSHTSPNAHFSPRRHTRTHTRTRIRIYIQPPPLPPITNTKSRKALVTVHTSMCTPFYRLPVSPTVPSWQS